MKRRGILILVFGLVLFVCLPTFISAQADSFGPLRFTSPRGFVRNQTKDAVIFSLVDRRRQRFCFITLYNAVASAPSPKKGFEKEWTEKVVGPWGAADKVETETEIINRLTFVSSGAEIYVDGNRATAYLAVLSARGKAASLLGIYNDNSCSDILQTFIDGLDIDANGS